MKARSLLYILSSILVMLLVSGCSHSTPMLDADAGFINVKNLPVDPKGVNPIRLQALRETATTLGAQGALAWRSKHIDKSLIEQQSFLNSTFDFNQLLLRHNVLPPILVQADNSLNLANSDTIRMADKTYKIVAAAHFVTTPPTWRDYLWLPYKKPSLPDHTLLPKSKAEAGIWNYYLKQGWKEGLQQANDIFMDNLSRLKRDYLGMLLYRKLLSEGMISAPHVSKADLGITGNSKQLRINDAIMRITAHAALQPKSSEWHPILTHD